MKYIQINKDWNADPNAPEVQLTVKHFSICLDFYLNSLQFTRFHPGDKARIIFTNCHKYALNSMNDEGYHMGQYRYKNADLPWGEFYQLDTDWNIDFPRRHIMLNLKLETAKGNHYIFFFKDNTFECVAKNYYLEFP